MFREEALRDLRKLIQASFVMSLAMENPLEITPRGKVRKRILSLKNGWENAVLSVQM